MLGCSSRSLLVVFSPMPDTQLPSPSNLPNLFWPLALGLAGLVAVTLLVGPLTKMLTHESASYNEGWNAYHQEETIQGKQLYGVPPGLVCDNYPPLSFHLIGLASRLTRDVNQTGRWVALVSLFLVAILCAAIVRQFTESTPLAAYTALSVVIWLAEYMPERVGVNDPQLLGMVFSLLGLYAYIREPYQLRGLCISALSFTASVFIKHNLLAFPAAVGLHLLLMRRWKGLLVWGAVVAGGSALLVALTQWVDGPYFIANMLVPRASKLELAKITDYFTLFQIPIALAVIWSLCSVRGSLGHIMILALIVAHVLAVVFISGDGVDRNIFFDCIVGLTIVSALVFSEYAPLLTGVKHRDFLLGALLVAPAFGVVIGLPKALRLEELMMRKLPERERDFNFAVKLLKSRPGPALCEDLLVCFDAGKPFVYDAYFANSMVKVGRVKEEELVALVRDASFQTVEVDLFPGEKNLIPGDRLRFTARFMEELMKRYRLEATLSGSVLLVPNE